MAKKHMTGALTTVNPPGSVPHRAPLLSTKLYIARPRPDLLPRPRLTQRLNDGLHRKLTLISAPAGFGKTTLLSEWSLQSKRPVAWISLDEGDNDPARFWAYFIAALQTLQVNVGDAALAAFQSPQPPPMEVVLTALINEIAIIPEPFALVLDDYHVIETQPVHSALTFLLNHLPPQMHLIIATRADPPLPLARLRGRGQLTELREADLRFTTDEAAAFLNQAMGLNLSAEQVAALEERTEGWIAGLQLAALSMQGRSDIPGFIAAFAGSHRYILDYLAEEVLQRQPEGVQTFLLQTAILDRLSGPLCDTVTGQGDSQTMLERLERANLFLVPLDEERRWYRYHRLFAELLRAYLQREQPNRVPGLHRRASEWYEQNGLLAEAVGHALAAKDFERAARLVEQAAPQMLMRGELVTLLGWLAALPDERIRAWPALCTYYAWVLTLTGQLDAVEPRLQDAEQGLQPDIPAAELQDLLGQIAAIRAYIAALHRDVPHAIELARQALEHLPEENPAVRAFVAFTLGGACLLSDDVAEACQAFAEASALGRAAGNVHVAIPALCNLAGLRALQGQLHQAAGLYQEALELATPSLAHQREGRGGRTLPVAAMAYSGLGGLLYEWNDLEGAMRHLREGIEQSKQWGNVDALASSYARVARVLQAQGDEAGALEALKEAGQLVRRHAVIPTTAARVAAYQASLWLAQGNLGAATRWVQERGLSVDDELGYLREPEHIALARVLIAQGKYDEALQFLARLRQAAETRGRMGSLIEILVLQALALQSQGNTTQAMPALERALSLAEPEGYVRLFVDEGAPMAKLLRQALSRGIAPNYVSRLLAAFGAEEQRGEEAEKRAPLLLEPLSERELEVLRLLAAGLSNREIAEKLIVAVGTVKAHIHNIYGKLGVQSRTQAVARARELGIL